MKGIEIEQKEKMEILEPLVETISSISPPIPLENNETFSKDINPTIEGNESFKEMEASEVVFDNEHPYPTCNQLVSLGFPFEVAYSISTAFNHPFDRLSRPPFSKRELYHVIYESDNPLESYTEMIKEKNRKLLGELDDYADYLNAKYGLNVKKQY